MPSCNAGQSWRKAGVKGISSVKDLRLELSELVDAKKLQRKKDKKEKTVAHEVRCLDTKFPEQFLTEGLRRRVHCG